MATSTRTVLLTPSGVFQAVAGLAAQLTQGAAAVGIVLVVRQHIGSVALAGAVAGALGIASGLARPVQGRLIYKLTCDLGNRPSVPASPSPLIEFGVLSENGDQHMVANYWDFYGKFDTYIVEGASPPLHADLILGTEPDPSGTIDDLQTLIGASEPIAAQVFTSPPVSAESRGWFFVPASP